MSLRCLFIVQGEGRGHLTQAMALRRMLGREGHRVAEVIVGQSERRAVPSFFEGAFEASVTYADSPSFVADGDDRSVRLGTTLAHELTRTPSFLDSLSTIEAAVDRHDPDVIVNFFEPLAGVYALRARPDVPVVAVAHQYMFHHPDYRFPPGRWLQRWATRTFAAVTAWGADRRLALSLYPAPDRRARDLVVLPPLLRDALFRQPTGRSAPFFLAYVLNSGYAEQIVRWHEAHPEVRVHCFWDRPAADPVEEYDDTLTFHQLDDKKFLSLMARCSGLVSTAGFESIAEAMYLGKPVQVVPVEGHFEQFCNAFDTVRARAGIRSTTFDLSRLQRFRTRRAVDAAPFRRWVRAAREQFVREIEAAAQRRPAPIPASVPKPDVPVLETVS
ncbi:MAG: glycosyltransferase [Bacteroidetes bacterium SW_9_63_38]|nr:MAG: glycosyltransferase [Bacteroidetes bacterium SW_9_63_38]